MAVTDKEIELRKSAVYLTAGVEQLSKS